MCCSSELTTSYSHAAHQILHVISYLRAEHTKSNSHVAFNSDSSAAEKSNSCVTHELLQVTRIKLNSTCMNDTCECI